MFNPLLRCVQQARFKKQLRWFFALKEDPATLADYTRMIKVAVCTALQNTALVPHFLYDGEENDLTQWLRSKHVAVIPSRSSLLDALEAKVRESPEGGRLCSILGGALLRLEIPRIMKEHGWDDEFVLYTDCDVMFLRDPVPALRRLRPRLFAVAPQTQQKNYVKMNSGVMWMNIPGMLAVNPHFFSFCFENIDRVIEGADQRAYREFFDGRWDRLPPEMNWKPYWGENRRASIIHFHGPKAYEFSAATHRFHIEIIQRLARGAYRHYSEVWEGLMTGIRE